MGDRPLDIQALLKLCKQIANPQERKTFLAEACRADPALRAQVEQLQAQKRRAAQATGSSGDGPFTKAQINDGSGSRTPVAPVEQTHTTPGSGSAFALTSRDMIPSGAGAEAVGTSIGPYKLLSVIGEGGFGTVYLAQQEAPVRRRVALKIIKLGMDTRRVIARFEQERQALAMMDHHHIAKVFDAGATATGRPYFVMEYVKGEPITAYCDAHAMPPTARLELFVSVCQAVQHAHQKGIIHRDIKPSNVLVCLQDEQPVAKVIDFGIAKATGGQITEKSIHTEERTMIGTPAYMSPEQTGWSEQDVDTRSDVYSLGVLLYELLIGRTPFDIQTLSSGGYAEAQRIIREVEPAKPSTRLVEMKDELVPVAAARGVVAGKLVTLVKGELDWIVMRAIEKDRDRRYESANALGMDVQRYIRGEAVVAAPPSKAYRVRKFMRRNKGVVTAGGLVAAALVLGIIGTSIGLVRADRQRTAAETARTGETEQRKEAEAQRDIAKQESARATALNDFMTQMLLSPDPTHQGKRDVTIMQALMKASEKADKTLKDEPAVEGAVRTLLGNTFRSLGRYDDSLKELKRAEAIRAGGEERDKYPHAESLRALGRVYFETHRYKEGELCYEHARRILESLGAKYATDLVTQNIDLVMLLVVAGKFDRAEAALTRAESLLPGVTGDTRRLRANLLDARAGLEARTGSMKKAEELSSQALGMTSKTENPTAYAPKLNDMAIVEMQRGELDQALAHMEEAVAIQKREFGEDNGHVAAMLENLANVHHKKKNYDKSLELLTEVIAIREKAFGANSFAVARTRFNMGVIAQSTGDPAKGLEMIDAALPAFKKQLGTDNVEIAQVLRMRAACRRDLGDFEGGLVDVREALRIFEKTVGPAQPSRVRAAATLASLLCASGAYKEGKQTLKATMAHLDRKKPDHVQLIAELEEAMEKCDAKATTSGPAKNKKASKRAP